MEKLLLPVQPILVLITPTFNNGHLLKRLYLSIKNQTYKKVCWIIIDDGSTDGTIDWLQSLQDDNLKFWREESRVGHTILYDKGIKSASNDIIGILHYFESERCTQ